MLPELFLIEDSGVLISGYKGYVGTHLLARLKASHSPLNKILSCEEAASHQKKYKLIHLASKVENTVEAFTSNLETDLKIF